MASRATIGVLEILRSLIYRGRYTASRTPIFLKIEVTVFFKLNFVYVSFFNEGTMYARSLVLVIALVTMQHQLQTCLGWREVFCRLASVCSTLVW